MAGIPYLMDAPPGQGYQYWLLEQIIAAINGYSGAGVPFNLTEIDNDQGPAVSIRNINPGQPGLVVYTSTANPMLIVDNTGVGVEGDFVISGGLTVNTLEVVNGAQFDHGASILNNNLALGAGVLVDFNDAVGDKLRLYSTTFGLGVNSSEFTIYTGGGANSVKIRDSAWNGTVLGTVFHTGNDGTGSTLDADFLRTLAPGNASGNIPISNGTVNTNLNADKVDGKDTGTGSGNLAFYDGNTEVVGAAHLNGLQTATTAGSNPNNIAVYNASGRVANSELLVGKTWGTIVGSIAYYDSNVRVVDSNKLNGLQTAPTAGSNPGNVAVYDGLGRVADATLLTGLSPNALGAAGTVAVTDGSGRVFDSLRLGGKRDAAIAGTTVSTIAVYDGLGRVADATLLTGLSPSAVGAAGTVAVTDGSGRVFDSSRLGGKSLGTSAGTVAWYDVTNGRVSDSDKLEGHAASYFGTQTDITNLNTSISTVAGNLANYLPLAGGTLTGDLTISGSHNLSVGANVGVVGGITTGSGGHDFGVDASAHQAWISRSGNANGAYKLSVGGTTDSIWADGNIYAHGNLFADNGLNVTNDAIVGGWLNVGHFATGATTRSTWAGSVEIKVPGVGIVNIPYF